MKCPSSKAPAARNSARVSSGVRADEVMAFVLMQIGARGNGAISRRGAGRSVDALEILLPSHVQPGGHSSAAPRRAGDLDAVGHAAEVKSAPRQAGTVMRVFAGVRHDSR